MTTPTTAVPNSAAASMSSLPVTLSNVDMLAAAVNVASAPNTDPVVSVGGYSCNNSLAQAATLAAMAATVTGSHSAMWPYTNATALNSLYGASVYV